VLLQELALIRWLPAQVRAIGYFPNVVLLSAFLGLGVGSLLAARRSLLGWWPVALGVLTGVSAYLHGIVFTQEASAEHLYLLYLDLPRNAPVIESVRLPIVVLFVLSAASFVPLGQYVAARLAAAKRVATSLWGYVADLCGSLLGVIAFTALSFAGTKPWLWFAVLALMAILLFERNRGAAFPAAVLGAVVAIVAMSERAQLYSPYYALSVRRGPEHTEILTNGSRHQIAVPLRNRNALRDPSLRRMREGYHVPYRLLAKPPKSVLILGAGTGNDVAVALDSGAERIDAVEIDPVILQLGRLHPDRPYADPRVHAINADARSFLNHTEAKYDLIVFGTLDSMTRLSALSSVRLDNYVYTAECFAAVRKHLNPGGGVALLFWTGSKTFIDRHIGAAITTGFGEVPVVVSRHYAMFDRMYLVGPAFAHLRARPPVTEELLARLRSEVNVPTDDWPYLYLQERTISPFYLSVIAMILGVAAIAVFGVSREMRESRPDVEMVLFGAAFMLIETRLVTEMNLVWSATWLTSAVVFGSILVTIIAGTVLMQLRPMRWPVAAAGLVLAMLATWAVPARLLVGLDPGARLGASVLFAGAPVFFASCCFALLFRDRARPDAAFGWNMLGAVAGGALEFSSMAIGIKATALLALVAYLAAFLVRQRRH
jgi:spermidine synthase